MGRALFNRMISRDRLCAASTALVVAALGVAGSAQAMGLTPMVTEIQTQGAAATARIQIGNETQSVLPFEAHISEVHFGPNGERTETAADQDFLIFPPQGLIGAGGHQVVRVQWVGDAALPASHSYYLDVRQLPVQLNDQSDPNAPPTARVQVVYEIKALVTVSPKGAKSHVEAVSAEPATLTANSTTDSASAIAAAAESPNGAAVRVTVRNDGNRHALMGGVTWIFDGTGLDGKPQHIVVRRTAASSTVGVGYLPPQGGVRSFLVPVPKAFAPGAIRVSFTE